MPIFRIENHLASQIRVTEFRSEKELQTFFENNLESLLGVRLIASEFPTGEKQRGRIDTLGIDQDWSPVIIEYKKKYNENVINQGFFYLDWLFDHKGDFTVAAQKKIGKEIIVDWSNPKLILIAESFSEYDTYGVKRMGGNVDLWEYHLYENGILYFDQIFSSLASGSKTKEINKGKEKTTKSALEYDIQHHIMNKPERIVSIFQDLRERIFSLAAVGEIIEKPTKVYIGYKHGKNFCELEIFKDYMRVWIDIEKKDLRDPRNISEDVSDKGHHGSGSTEIKITDTTDLDYAATLIVQSYKNTI